MKTTVSDTQTSTSGDDDAVVCGADVTVVIGGVEDDDDDDVILIRIAVVDRIFVLLDCFNFSVKYINGDIFVLTRKLQKDYIPMTSMIIFWANSRGQSSVRHHAPDQR